MSFGATLVTLLSNYCCTLHLCEERLVLHTLSIRVDVFSGSYGFLLSPSCIMKLIAIVLFLNNSLKQLGALLNAEIGVERFRLEIFARF